MCPWYFLVLSEHCQHERAYTFKKTKNKKVGAPEFWCLGTKTLVPQMFLTATHPPRVFCEIWESERWNSGQKRQFSGWFLGWLGLCLGISHPTPPFGKTVFLGGSSPHLGNHHLARPQHAAPPSQFKIKKNLGRNPLGLGLGPTNIVHRCATTYPQSEVRVVPGTSSKLRR